MNGKRLGLLALGLVLVYAGPAGAVPDPNRNAKKVRWIEADLDPGNLQAYREKVGKTFYFEVTGRGGAGTVWGTGVYTDDSILAAAAVHAGALREGQKGFVKVTILKGQANYPGSTQNGVTSQNWANWNASYRVAPVTERNVRLRAHLGKVLPDPGSLSGYQGKVGKTFFFRVTGAVNGPVWGTDVYTDDSSLATAAVHAGVLRNGQQGIVKVTILPGQPGYQGSVQNGVTSQQWANWNGSFKVEAVKPAKGAKK